MKKALVIGIDDYLTSPLIGCVNDASAVANTLERNGDGSPNFSVKLLTSNVTTASLYDAIPKLFEGDADTAVLYFSGHGLINPSTNAGYIVSRDAKKGAWGMALSEILNLANNAYPHIKSTVIILDCCHAGYAGEVSGMGNDARISVIGSGVTILTACHRDALAKAGDPHSLFTGILLDGLSGSASDVCGRITPAALYSLIDQTLGEWEQRPIYKANVQTFVTLRAVNPKIPLDILRRLPEYFPEQSYLFPLNPSFEPDRENIPKELRHLPIDEKNTKIFKELQMCNRHGLVVPVDADHMYYAAIESKACKLTALGAHYRQLAELKRI